MFKTIVCVLVILSSLITMLASNMTTQVGFEKWQTEIMILFQDIRYRSRNRRSASYQPPCAHGDNWCEEVMDYPESYIKQVIIITS